MGILSFSGTVAEFLIWLKEQKREEVMNLAQIQEQAEQKYSVNTRLNKRINTLDARLTQLEMDFATLFLILTNINDAISNNEKTSRYMSDPTTISLYSHDVHYVNKEAFR